MNRETRQALSPQSEIRERLGSDRFPCARRSATGSPKEFAPEDDRGPPKLARAGRHSRGFRAWLRERLLGLGLRGRLINLVRLSFDVHDGPMQDLVAIVYASATCAVRH